MRTYTKIPDDTFNKMIRNAGILLIGQDSFVPESKTLKESAIIGATSGGISFTDTVSYVDLGENIDNCPKNTKELKDVESREVKLSGTFKTVDGNTLAMLLGPADYKSDEKTVIARDVINTADFKEIWWVCDYSGTDGGFIAINLKNTLSTGGLSIQSADAESGEISFEFTCHYSIESEDVVPYTIYIDGTAA